jgi:4-aminobutyrate aminotransferase-like enzyme
VFAHEKRAELTRILQLLSPDPENYDVFLLSTGSEAIENSIKLSKTFSLQKYGHRKKYIVSFKNAFHGRTLGAQLAGGIDKQREWIVDEGRTFIRVPFPDGYKNENISFDLFLESLKTYNVKPDEISGVITESYQGVGPDFIPYEYAQNLQTFCQEHDIVMICDEVQSGFGRTGRWFGFEHYDIRPDLIACGKGLSSSLPISAVIGRKDIMDLYEPGSMTSTHSGSPLPVAAALESIRIIEREDLIENARRLGGVLLSELKKIKEKYPETLGCVHGMGLVAGVQVVRRGTKQPAPDIALKINERCFQKGLLMFAPVGIGGECIKIAPPLMINEDALRESISVLREACAEVLAG